MLMSAGRDRFEPQACDNPYQSPNLDEKRPEPFTFSIGSDPTDEQYAHARDLVGKGMAFPFVREQLTRVGASKEQAKVVIYQVAAALIEPLFLAGSAAEKLQQRLYDRGLDVSEVTVVIESLQRKHGRQLRSMGLKSGRSYLISCIYFLAGLAIALGNTSGIFPTISGAGSLLMIIGGIIGGLGYYFRRS
jgi:hypothetical protein